MESKRSELEKLSIYELRIRGRNAGVKAVTTKKHDEIVNEILQIESGELAPFKSNMGRPPKNNFFISSGVESAINDSTLISSSFENELDSKENEMVFEATSISGINNNSKFLGIVREVSGGKLLKNYLSTGPKYIVLPTQLEAGHINGMVVEGVATYKTQNCAIARTCDEVTFNDIDKNLSHQKLKVEICETSKQMYDFINTDLSENKIICEVEANKFVSNQLENALFLKTDECDDILQSYNMLLDCKNLIEYLNKEDKPFCLYLIDIQYMYSILTMYYLTKNAQKDLNAGQYFKELISIIKNSKQGKLVIFEKNNNKPSGYLDIIINKYCM